MIEGRAPWLFPAVAVVTGCSRPAPTGGLLVTMGTDLTLESVALTRLDVEVRSPIDAGRTLRDHSYAIGTDTPLPATMVIESDGDPTASVVIDVSVWKGAEPIDAREYRVEKIPTDRFAPIGIVFSARCSAFARVEGETVVSTCPTGETCDPSSSPGACASNLVVVGEDAGANSPLSEGGDDALEAESPVDASPFDATVGADAQTQPTTLPDSGEACEAGDPRCTTASPGCRTACVPATYCFKGECVPVPPSCLGTDDTACTSYEVPGGSFYRSYDDAGYPDRSAPATITGLRIDAYEVSVGRFANFINAVLLGDGLPEAGAGKHAYLNGGMGLANVSDAGSSYETGWDPTWDTTIATTQADWDSNLSGFVSSTWYPPRPAVNADLPINTVTWYEAYAFCIWDGGFLPTEAEWNYAASGGDEQRVYPWGGADPGTASEYAIYDCYYGGNGPGSCGAWGNIAPLGTPPMGDGKFGQSDLAGSMWEWTLDAFAPYVTPCNDCVALSGAARVFRGGSFYQTAAYLAAGSRVSGAPASRFDGVGFRCARTP
jgi:sulfatase modifying factor 1